MRERRPRGPGRARAALAGAVQAGLRRAGYELHLYSPLPKPTPEDERRVRLLRTLGVTLLLDVGANAGQFALLTREAGYDGKIVSFEPLAGPFDSLAAATADDAKWEARRLALGDADGDAELNVSANSYSSSMLPIGDRHLASAPEAAYVGTETVPTARLATVFEELAAPSDRVYLKLDVQGYEMAVLRGAEPVLERIEAVQAEMSLVPLYEGAPRWRELVDWLEERGFRLAGLEPGHDDQRTGEVLQADGIFVR